MKTTLSVLLAVMALPLSACLAPSADSGDEQVGEAEDALSTWVADTQLPGQSSQSAPAITTYNNDAVMVVRGSTNSNLYMSKYDGSSWSSVTPISGQTTKSTVALTQHGAKLHMAYPCDANWKICYSNHQAGSAWSPPVTLSFNNDASPVALASEPINNRLMIVFLGGGGYVQTAFQDGNNWTYPTSIVENYLFVKAAKTPALAVHNGRVHMVFESLNGVLRHTSWNGGYWAPPRTISKWERNNPALASYGGLLYLFHRGVDDNKVWWSSSSDDGWSWTPDVSIPGALTTDSPAVATGGFFLTLVHRGQNTNQLWWSAQAFW